MSTAKAILGALALRPDLIDANEDLNADLFTGLDREIYSAIDRLWSDEKLPAIPLDRILNIVGSRYAADVSLLISPDSQLMVKYPDTFRAAVDDWKKQRATGQIYSELQRQVRTGQMDVDRLRPLLDEVDTSGRRKQVLAEEVRALVEENDGDFSLNWLYKETHAFERNQQCAIRQAVRKLKQDGVIEATGGRSGNYRKVQKDSIAIDFTAPENHPLDLSLTFGLDNLVNIYPGNIVVVSGSWDSGKTAVLLDITKRNMDKFEVHYFSSEMGASEMAIRLKKHEDVPDMSSWHFKAYERNSDFANAIVPGAVNMIDYLEVSDSFWLVAKDLAEIYKKLDGGVAFVAMQKGSKAELGRGGDFSAEKPRLYITLDKEGDSIDHKKGIVKIVKAKNWKSDSNPNGKCMKFNLYQGWKFTTSGIWEYPESFEAEKNTRTAKGRLF